ncbi:MAG: menaquinone biosynthetic enzyme MqnA/MqnD family protein [Phycisphaerales bacterium JB043]
MSTVAATSTPRAPCESIPLRIGCVSYFNTLPMIEGLEKLRHVTLEPAAPSHLIGMLEAGDIDVALAPVIDSQRASCELTLLPCGMIGSDGSTMTVRLFSAVALDTISTIHADTDSHTSVALARLLMRQLHAIDPEIVPFDARERVAMGSENTRDDSFPDTLLMIGDKVVTDSPPAVRYTHQLDLGDAWKQWTGLPFVYAAWMCRASDEDSPAIRSAVSLLDRQRRLNATRLEWIVARRAGERRWPRDLAHTYLRGTMLYEPDARSRESIERFLDETHEAGILERRSPTRWLDGM